VLAVAIAGNLLEEPAAASMDQAVALADGGDWSGADPIARRTASADPDVLAYAFTAGLTAARAGDHEAAISYFQNVASRTELSEAWLNLAAEQLAVGRSDEARESLQHALRLGVQRIAIAVPAADLALQLGDEELAVAAFSDVIAEVPSLATDEYWRGEGRGAAIRDRMLAGAFAIASPDRAWELALMTGDRARAESLTTSAPDPELARSVIAAWSGDTGARDNLLAQCRRRPFDANRVLWCARLEARRGQQRSADRFRRVVSAYQGGTFYRGAEIGITFDPGPRRQEQAAAFWGVFSYRRSTPRDMLVPSLARVVNVDRPG